MSTYKEYLNKTIGRVLTNETEINIKLTKINHKLVSENLTLLDELSQLKNSKLFKLWPIYIKIKKLFIK